LLRNRRWLEIENEWGAVLGAARSAIFVVIAAGISLAIFAIVNGLAPEPNTKFKSIR
jgi:hypothetical protein